MPRKEPSIIFTDSQCVIGELPCPGIPLLISFDNCILEMPSDWLRHLIVIRRKATSSVRQFAYHLKCWWSYINRIGIAWNEVDDFVMVRWRDECLKKYNAATVNGYVSTVFRMYLWSERNGYTHGLIGEADWEKGSRPPLSVELSTGRNGMKIYSSPLLIPTTAAPILPTPTNDEITKVHEALEELYRGNISLMIRDALILSWMEQTGIRRAEVLALKRSQIPEWDEILVMEETSEKKEITVIGKGNKKRSIWVGTDLLSQTRDYIEEERQALTNHLRQRLGSNYKNPKEIFLSSKSGGPLHPDTISQKFAQAFRKAGVKGSGHRVRARFLTNLVEDAFEREFEKLGSVPDLTSVLLPVAQIAGHSNVETLQPYLAIAKKRLLRRTVAERAAAAEERALGAERRCAFVITRMKMFDILGDLVKAVESGSKKRIISASQHLLSTFN